MEGDAAGLTIVLKDRVDDVEYEAERNSGIHPQQVVAQPRAIEPLT
jgi:hypothetical protein